MDIYKELKIQAIHPILKKFFFKKNGNIFTREIESGVVHIVEISIKTGTKNDFTLSVIYGIYFNEIMELLYGFPFNIKHGTGDCIYHGSTKKKEIKQYWISNHFKSFEVFKDDVSGSLENSIIPFLNGIVTGEQLLALFQDDINNYIKNDSTLALKIGCLNFLLGEKDKGNEIVRMVIRASKERYEFAEKVLERMGS